MMSTSLFFAAVLSTGFLFDATFTDPPKNTIVRYYAGEGVGLFRARDDFPMRVIPEKDVSWLFDETDELLLFGIGRIGRHIERFGGTKLHIVKKDGSGLRQITDILVEGAMFNAQADKVYFVDEAAKDLYELDLVTGKQRLIRKKASNPQLLPQEKLIVYYKINDDWEQGHYYENAIGLAVLDLATGEETVLVRDPMVYNALWVPKLSILIPNVGGGSGLYNTMYQFRLSSDGSKLNPIPAQEHLEGINSNMLNTPFYKWSQDGNVLAYSFDRQIFTKTLSPDGKSMSMAKKIARGDYPRWEQDGTLSYLTFDARQALQWGWRRIKKAFAFRDYWHVGITGAGN